MKKVFSKEQLSEPARALVRRFLRDSDVLGGAGRGRCVPEEVAMECTKAGLAIQTENYPDECREQSIMWPKEFRRRAAELGFDVPEAKGGDA